MRNSLLLVFSGVPLKFNVFGYSFTGSNSDLPINVILLKGCQMDTHIPLLKSADVQQTVLYCG